MHLSSLFCLRQPSLLSDGDEVHRLSGFLSVHGGLTHDLFASAQAPSLGFTGMILTPDAAIADSSANAPNYVEMIETVISSLEQEGTAMVSHAQEGYLWKFGYGNVEVFVQLTGLTDDDTLTVWSSVMGLPEASQADLMLKLLQLNWSTTLEARFALLDGNIVVVTSRTLAELSPGEVSRCITIVATLADDYQAALKTEFGS